VTDPGRRASSSRAEPAAPPRASPTVAPRPRRTARHAPGKPGALFLTVARVAVLIDATEDKVRAMIAAGSLKAVRIGRGARAPWRIARQTFVREFGVEPPD